MNKILFLFINLNKKKPNTLIYISLWFDASHNNNKPKLRSINFMKIIIMKRVNLHIIIKKIHFISIYQIYNLNHSNI